MCWNTNQPGGTGSQKVMSAEGQGRGYRLALAHAVASERADEGRFDRTHVARRRGQRPQGRCHQVGRADLGEAQPAVEGPAVAARVAM